MLASSRTERASVNKQLVNTISDLVLSSSSTSEASSLQPCSNDETDPKIILNISYCATDGMTRMIVRTTDTDVFVVPTVDDPQQISATGIWVLFGVGKNFSYNPVHQIASQLGPRPASALPMSHAYSGCDTVPLCRQRKGQGMDSLASVSRGYICIPVSRQWTFNS